MLKNIFTLSFTMALAALSFGCQESTSTATSSNLCSDEAFLSMTDESLRMSTTMEFESNYDEANKIVDTLNIQLDPLSKPNNVDSGGYECEILVKINFDNASHNAEGYESIEQQVTVITNGGFNEDSEFLGTIGIVDEGLLNDIRKKVIQIISENQ